MKEFDVNKYGIKYNPFPPAASGVSSSNQGVILPQSVQIRLDHAYSILSQGTGVKSLPIIGEYGMGKTTILKGYLREFFEKKNYLTFYFENPGVQFYDLANQLLRNLGRFEFSKAIWELCKDHLRREQQFLFQETYEDSLRRLRTKSEMRNEANKIARVLKDDLKITKDEEIAAKLATMVVETSSKPYFEYRDFVAGQQGALVPEKEEAAFFSAILNLISNVYNTNGVVFLLDEFEDVALAERRLKSKVFEYLATLRRLIDVSEVDFWIVIAMTPAAKDSILQNSPALWDRLSKQGETELILEPLSLEECNDFVKWWLYRVREVGKKHDPLFPFQGDAISILKDYPEIRKPRPLVKFFFTALSNAVDQGLNPPIPQTFLIKVLKEYTKAPASKPE